MKRKKSDKFDYSKMSNLCSNKSPVNKSKRQGSVCDTFEIHVTDKGLIHNEVHLISILMDKILKV